MKVTQYAFLNTRIGTRVFLKWEDGQISEMSIFEAPEWILNIYRELKGE